MTEGFSMTFRNSHPEFISGSVESKTISFDPRITNISNIDPHKACLIWLKKQTRSSSPGHYQTENSHQFSQLPDAQKNQQIINEVLSTTLERGFSDISLANFLAKN